MFNNQYNNSFYCWWSFPLLSWTWCFVRQGNCKERLDSNQSWCFPSQQGLMDSFMGRIHVELYKKIKEVWNSVNFVIIVIIAILFYNVHYGYRWLFFFLFSSLYSFVRMALPEVWELLYLDLETCAIWLGHRNAGKCVLVFTNTILSKIVYCLYKSVFYLS